MFTQKFYVFRHGETDWNKSHKLQGHSDIPLNDLGMDQAQGLRSLIRTLPIVAVVSSDLGRAIETAKIATEDRFPIHADRRLREAFLGDIEGLTYDEVNEKYGEEMIQAWRTNTPEHLDFQFPKGESKREVVQRATECLIEWSQKLGGGPLGVSAHGGLIRLLLSHARSDNREPIFVKNCALFQLDYDHTKKAWHSDLLEVTL